MSLRSFRWQVDVSALVSDIETLLARLSAARATLLDNLSEVTVARGSRIDEIDTLLARLSEARVALIDTIVGMSEEGSGTLTADGTVQEIIDKTSSRPFICQLLLDTRNMAGADQIEVNEEMMVLGNLQKFTKTRITGKQEEPVLVFAPKYAVREYKVTLQQLAGTYRSFDWSLIVQERA